MKFIALSDPPLRGVGELRIDQNLLTKYLLVMSLTSVFLFSAFLVAGATGYSQGISLNLKHAPMVRVFSEIKKQTGFSFIYSYNDIAGKTKPMDLNVRNAGIGEVLDLCFRDVPLTYSIDGLYIIVRSRPEGHHDDLRPGPIRIAGKVVDENGQGLAGASIKVGNARTVVMTGGNGVFSLQLADSSAILVISYIGYKSKEVSVSGADVDLVIRLERAPVEMKGVEVVSTGYESLPKERVTGSFEKVNNELFNRATGPTVLARLEGIVPAILFDKRQLTGGSSPGLNQLTIRGQSTLASNTSPLIVLNNIPYEGDINNINPNDVESITILKDAAAASIWGVRAGNGVIVITTKKGSYDRPLQVSFNSNLIVQDRPDLWYLPQMETGDYTGVEKFLFDKGNYDYRVYDSFSHPFISPVVDLLAKVKSGVLSEAAADAQINALNGYDARKDYLKYVYRKSINQQYAINLTGGSAMLNYILSVGYDKALGNKVRVGSDRITLRSGLSFKPLPQLEIEAGMLYTQSRNQSPGGDLSSFLNYNPAIRPYTRLVDDQGHPQVIGRDYNAGFAADPGDNRLDDWRFRPLGELDASTISGHNYDALFNLGVRYQIFRNLSADLKYQYERTVLDNQDWEGPNSYFTRNLYNLFTQPIGSLVEHPIPYGGILNQTDGNARSHTGRGQLNFSKEWGGRHRLTAIGGGEIRESRSGSHSFATYGYDDVTLTSKSINSAVYYPWIIPVSYQGGGFISDGIHFSSQTIRLTSLYGNAAYTYDDRYTLTASARKDASNLFGVNANRRGVPLWSAGLGWEISHESFYKWKFMPLLKFRATYGYNGNTNNTISAYSVINYARGAASFTNLPSANILYPANPDLRWERVGIANFGLDFGTAGSRLTGSLEYFTKDSKDLIYSVPVDLTSGFNYTSVNGVAMKGKGIDLSLHSINLSPGFPIRWTTDLIFSYNTGKVTKYTPLMPPGAGDYLSKEGMAAPIAGKPLYALFSYRWAGLDPQTGDPQGYFDNKVSKDYTSMDYDSVQNLRYHGSGIPLIYGALRNTFSWKGVSLSVNILYKLDYYFRRSSIDYYGLFDPNKTTGNADFARRWQKPGDEKTTNVPSMVYPDDSYRDLFYMNSAALVSRADHIRLQDITASYSFTKVNRYFKSMKVYGNVSNLGIIWRANKEGIDPDYGAGFPAPKTFSIGLSGIF